MKRRFGLGRSPDRLLTLPPTLGASLESSSLLRFTSRRRLRLVARRSYQTISASNFPLNSTRSTSAISRRSEPSPTTRDRENALSHRPVFLWFLALGAPAAEGFARLGCRRIEAEDGFARHHPLLHIFFEQGLFRRFGSDLIGQIPRH